MTKLVRPSRSRARARWISTSVRVSTELVASSRMRIAGSARNARAIVMSCFSPADSVDASSSSTVSIALRQRAHEVVDVCRLCCRLHLRGRGAVRSRRRCCHEWSR